MHINSIHQHKQSSHCAVTLSSQSAMGAPSMVTPWVSLVLALSLFGSSAIAQESNVNTATLARPKVVSDGEISIYSGGYGMRYYFQESKDFTKKDAHVYYEPLIYIELEKDGRIKHYIDDDSVLTLYVYGHQEPKDIEDALREELIEAAKSGKIPKLEEHTTPYRISVLSMSEAQFESAKSPLIQSKPFKSSFTEKNPILIFFEFDTRVEAESFVKDLQENRDQLVFKYKFHGVSDENCIARADSSRIQDIDLFKEVTGKGGKGFVSRDQVVNIADKIIKNKIFTTRCADLTTADDLMNKLLDKVGDSELMDISDWKTLDELVRFDADSFKADLETSLKDVKNKVIRDQIFEATSNAISEANSSAIGLGRKIDFDLFSTALNVSWAKNNSEFKAGAEKEFTDALKKMGIHTEWKGERFIPKSVDVYSVGQLESAWGETIEIKYSIPKGEFGGDSIRLTKAAWQIYTPKKVAEKPLIKRLNELDTRLNALEPLSEHIRINRYDGGKKSELTIEADTMNIIARDNDVDITANDDVDIEAKNVVYITAINDDVEITAINDDVEIRAKDRVYIRAKNEVDITARKYVDIKDRSGEFNISACYYRLSKPEESGDYKYFYDTGMNDDLAFIGDWNLSCNTKHTPGITMVRGKKNNSYWVITISNWKSCDAINLHTVFMDGANVGWLGTEKDTYGIPLIKEQHWCSDRKTKNFR